MGTRRRSPAAPIRRSRSGRPRPARRPARPRGPASSGGRGRWAEELLDRAGNLLGSVFLDVVAGVQPQHGDVAEILAVAIDEASGEGTVANAPRQEERLVAEQAR